MAETTPRSKIQILDRPLMKPGKCALCGAGAKPVIDIGLNVEWYGRFYLCVDCMAEAASAIDYVPQADLLEVQLASSQSFEQELENRKMVAVPNESIRTLVALVDDIRLSSSISSNSLLMEESTTIGEETGTGTQGEYSSDSVSDSDSSGNSSTSGGKGSSGIPSLDALQLD